MKNCKKQNKIFGLMGSASGGGAIASLHNVCHSICIGAVSLFAAFGIIISDTALMFLQDYNIYFWLMGLFFLLVSVFLMIREKPVSVNLMMFNTGLLIASNPLSQNLFTTFVGTTLSAMILFIFIKNKMEVITWKRR